MTRERVSGRAVRRLVAALAVLAAAGANARAGAPYEDAMPPVAPPALRESARAVLEKAFDNLYGCDVRDRLEIETRVDGKVVRRHELSMLRKNIDGRAHLLVRFVTDNDYWDMRALKIENHDRSDDHFVWNPALQRVRRMTSVQRADAFQGTDLTMEDLETHRASRFEVLGRAFSVLQGEPVHVLTIAPLYPLGYRRAILFVSQRDYAVLEAHYYRRDSARRPYKVSRAPRDEMVSDGGHVLPRLWIFTDYERGTETWTHYVQREVANDLDDRLFSQAMIEGERRVRALER